jgi:hypothetical protein
LSKNAHRFLELGDGEPVYVPTIACHLDIKGQRFSAQIYGV